MKTTHKIHNLLLLSEHKLSSSDIAAAVGVSLSTSGKALKQVGEMKGVTLTSERICNCNYYEIESTLGVLVDEHEHFTHKVYDALFNQKKYSTCDQIISRIGDDSSRAAIRSAIYLIERWDNVTILKRKCGNGTSYLMRVKKEDVTGHFGVDYRTAINLIFANRSSEIFNSRAV